MSEATGPWPIAGCAEIKVGGTQFHFFKEKLMLKVGTGEDWPASFTDKR